MDYKIIFRQNSAGELLGPFYLDTNLGRVVMIFSTQPSLAEAMTYAQRSIVTPGIELTIAIRSADSLDEFVQALDAFLHEAFSEWNASYISEGNELFDDILAQLRDQNMASRDSS